jgi:hypothetical protein
LELKWYCALTRETVFSYMVTETLVYLTSTLYAGWHRNAFLLCFLVHFENLHHIRVGVVANGDWGGRRYVVVVAVTGMCITAAAMTTHRRVLL